jgi:DNA-binding NarL/FixJ family response regulator
MKVFIADDSQVMRERIIEMLSELPEIEIIGQAQDGIEATNLIEKLNPDVVILDIRMPRGNGMDVLQNIKKNNPALIVIMLTNYPYPQYRKKCMASGADYFFDKSTEFEIVTEVLKELIPSR